MKTIEEIIHSHRRTAKELQEELSKGIIDEQFDNEAQEKSYIEDSNMIADLLTELQQRREPDKKGEVFLL